MRDRVVGQITSGRWLLTVASAVALLKLTWTICRLMEEGKITLETATYVAICMSVLNTIGLVTVFYFNKSRENDGNGNGGAGLQGPQGAR